MKKAALLGFGTVGGGVAEMLRGNAAGIASSVGEGIELKYILVRHDYPESPFADIMVKDISVITDDPEISVVAECIGGATVAYEYTKRCLTAGKSVVTSNKELVAEKGLELLALAKEKHVSFLFEASVGGGIPIIRPLTNCLAANTINEVYGIINGTTNYILTQMIQCGNDFWSALKEAQRLGYAEADPTADVDGIDACRKICILADLCFGKNISPAWVDTKGITGVTAEDVEFAREMGYSIKLLGRAMRLADGRVTAFVAPHFIKRGALLADVNDVLNGIMVKGDAVGDCFFCGAGAGKMPTASAVVADIMDTVRHEKGGKYIDWTEGSRRDFGDSDELVSRWVVKCRATKEQMQAAFEAEPKCSGAQCAAETKPMSKKEVLAAAGSLPVLSMYRILD